MKKIISALLTVVVIFAFCTTAFATTFTRTVQCVNENDYVRSEVSDEKQVDNHNIVVYHNAQGCSNSYTKHFRGYEYETEGFCGSKWVTPNSRIRISGSGFTEGWRYYLTMRGNTKYNQYEGLSSIVLAGWFLPDY